ncbi:hypothetical protein ACMYYO_09260 [Dermacoccaceae bacterium W4C1]
MKIRPLVAASLTAPALVVGALNAATPAQAAAQCILTAPTKISISRPYVVVSPKVSGSCVQGSGEAYWTVVHSNGGDFEGVGADSTGVDEWEAYADEPSGTYAWEPDGAIDDSGNDVTQNRPTFQVKFASWSYVGATRSGTRVTLKAQVNKYSGDALTHVPYNYARGEFQMRAVGAHNWHTVAAFRADTAGKASVSYTQKANREYRVVTTEIGSIWGSTSSTTVR